LTLIKKWSTATKKGFWNWNVWPTFMADFKKYCICVWDRFEIQEYLVSNIWKKNMIWSKTSHAVVKVFFVQANILNQVKTKIISHVSLKKNVALMLIYPFWVNISETLYNFSFSDLFNLSKNKCKFWLSLLSVILDPFKITRTSFAQLALKLIGFRSEDLSLRR